MTSLPLPVRLLNMGGGALRAVGLETVKLNVDNLLRTAKNNAGLDDFGEDDFIGPLKLLIKGLEEEAELSQLGRLIARNDILRNLENRLGIVALLQKHPEIEEQPIEKPLFVVGPPRSGTTIFHDLLAMDPDNRVPQSWEASYPLPPPETATYQSDPRIARCQSDLDQVDKLIPEFKKMHPMGALRAQECVTMTSVDATSMIYLAQFYVPTYDKWIMECEMHSALKWHRRYLQVLQWKCPGVRWALKSPQHMWHLEYVHREYPDALIVQTHRDPVKSVISMSSLTARAGQPDVSPVDQGRLDAARAKLETAERICQMFHDPESGSPRGGAGAESNYLWSKRRMLAEIELIQLDHRQGTEADAIQRHLQWMRAWNDRVVESGVFSPFGIATTEYYIAEAEAMLASATRP